MNETDANTYRATLDWSKFDTTVPRFIIRIAFNILKEKIDFNTLEHFGHNKKIDEGEYLKLF